MIAKLWNSLNTLLDTVAFYLRDVLLLIIRLFWGWQFFVTGKGKLMDLDKVTGFFTELHLPFPRINAIMAGSTECFGGLLLMIGLFTRVITVPLIFTMIVAYLTADIDAVKAMFSDPDKFTEAAPFLFLLACVIVFAFGPGRYSADGLMNKKADKI